MPMLLIEAHDNGIVKVSTTCDSIVTLPVNFRKL